MDDLTKQRRRRLEEAAATHAWGEPVKFAGSIADGPPPGVNHRGAAVYECTRCGKQRLTEIPPDLVLDPRFDDAHDPPTRGVSGDWDGLPCTGSLADER